MQITTPVVSSQCVRQTDRQYRRHEPCILEIDNLHRRPVYRSMSAGCILYNIIVNRTVFHWSQTCIVCLLGARFVYMCVMTVVTHRQVILRHWNRDCKSSLFYALSYQAELTIRINAKKNCPMSREN